MIYHFKKRDRMANYDFDNSYCFKSGYPNGDLFQLNKKATKITVSDDCLIVEVADWYLTPSGSFTEQTIKRRLECELLQKQYLEYKKIIND